jgi:hypothetical protein
MSFNHAKVKALREESIRRGELGSPVPLSPAVLGVSGGEGVGGSVGGFGDVLMPGGGAASVVGSVEDSVEDVFSEFEVGVKTEKGAVKLIFPLYDQYGGGVSEPWCWSVCGGLIGGARGNRFCTKIIEDPNVPHCGVASHAAHKADLKQDHGYIPSVNDRLNIVSAFLSPTLSNRHFPNSINDLASQALSHEEWVASLAYLPTKQVMERSSEVEVEIATEALEKS